MITPRPSVDRFARTIVRAELARDGAGAEGHVAQRIVKRLHQELEKLVGPAGFEVLLARSLVLAQRSHPSLAPIAAQPGGTLRGLEDTSEEPEGAAIVISSHFIELLVTLIGEDLTMRLIGDLWSVGTEKEGLK